MLTGLQEIHPVFNCSQEQSVSALLIPAKAEFYNRGVIAGVELAAEFVLLLPLKRPIIRNRDKLGGNFVLAIIIMQKKCH